MSAIEEATRTTGLLRIETIVTDPDESALMEHAEKVMLDTLAWKVSSAIADGRRYVIQAGSVGKEPCYRRRHDELYLYQHVMIVLANRDDAEIGEAVASIGISALDNRTFDDGDKKWRRARGIHEDSYFWERIL